MAMFTVGVSIQTLPSILIVFSIVIAIYLAVSPIYAWNTSFFATCDTLSKIADNLNNQIAENLKNKFEEKALSKLENILYDCVNLSKCVTLACEAYSKVIFVAMFYEMGELVLFAYFIPSHVLREQEIILTAAALGNNAG